MSVLDHLIEAQTGNRRVSDFRKPVVTDYTCVATGKYRPQLDANEEYVLSATVQVSFWANKVQYREARKQAERVLLQRLYGETLALLAEARKSVIDGDAQAVLERLTEIENYLLK